MRRRNYERFDPEQVTVVPPVLTGKGLRTTRGYIRPSEPAGFGTIEPMSVLIVNRFVIPFETHRALAPRSHHRRRDHRKASVSESGLALSR